MVSKYIRAINIQVLTLATKEGLPDDRSRPILRMELDDGRDFLMSGIPTETAYNISHELSIGQSEDARLQIYSLVGQLALIDKVEIDLVVPGTDVYQATIYLTPEGFTNQLQFQMIPSNAILLAVANDSTIFVADELVKAADKMRS